MTKEQVLRNAMDIVTGERYGSTEENLGNIADLWTSYMQMYDANVKVTPTDVAVMMILLKVARVASGFGVEDSIVDIAGYAALIGDVVDG